MAATAAAMAARDNIEPTRLMLRIDAGVGAIERLAVVLAAAPIASVVIAPVEGQPLTAAAVRPMIAVGQKAGAAMLIEGDAQLVRATGADGVHLPVSEASAEAYAAARALLGAKSIVGVDVGRSRHDAMTLGENGADYVAFGIAASVHDRDDATEHQLELIEWWAELFEVPCVALGATDHQSAGALAAAGADFVCISIVGGLSPAALEAEARSWSAAIGHARTSKPVA